MFKQLLSELYIAHEAFVDYIVIDPQTKESTDTALVRKRTYFTPFLFGFVIKLVTLGMLTLRVHIRTTYYRFSLEQSKQDGFKIEDHALSRKAYRALIHEQRVLYATAQVPDNIVADICTPENVKYTSKLRKSVIAFILAVLLSATVLIDPFGGVVIAAPGWWWYVLKCRDLKDAQTKKDLYDRYLKNHPEKAVKPSTPTSFGVVEVSDSPAEDSPTVFDETTDSSAPANGKKALTKEVIRNDLHLQKNSLGKYLEQVFLIVLMLVLVFLGRPTILVMGIFLLFNINTMVFDDIQRTRLKYVVLDRKVVDKTVDETDDGDLFKLWFKNEKGDSHVAIIVDRAFYDAAANDEEFYIVILKGDTTPCLCYRKSEWTV